MSVPPYFGSVPYRALSGGRRACAVFAEPSSPAHFIKSSACHGCLTKKATGSRFRPTHGNLRRRFSALNPLHLRRGYPGSAARDFAGDDDPAIGGSERADRPRRLTHRACRSRWSRVRTGSPRTRCSPGGGLRGYRLIKSYLRGGAILLLHEPRHWSCKLHGFLIT